MCEKQFPSKEGHVKHNKELKFGNEDIELENKCQHLESKDNYKRLNQEVRSLGQNIPPLVSAYINLSNTMKVFGTAVNDTFGDVEETAILITIKDIYKEKRDRHIETYVQELEETICAQRMILQ